METILQEAIDGYEKVIGGDISGRAYLIEVIEKFRLTDDELIYLVYMAADVATRRPSLEPVV